MANIEKIFELYEGNRGHFEEAMNLKLRALAYGNLCACDALLIVAKLIDSDSVEVDQMQSAQVAMCKWYFEI